VKYKLIRKLKGCPLPVGTVSGESKKHDGWNVYGFAWTVPSKSCIPDNRECFFPYWLCACMPHYFKPLPTGAGRG